MSAVYRIDLEHRPAETAFPWKATVVQLSNGASIHHCVDDTEEGVLNRARAAIAAGNTAREPYSVYADEAGAPVSGEVREGV